MDKMEKVKQMLADIRKRDEEADPGPWVVYNGAIAGSQDYLTGEVEPDEETAEFIAKARTDLPACALALQRVVDNCEEAIEQGVAVNAFASVLRVIQSALIEEE